MRYPTARILALSAVVAAFTPALASAASDTPTAASAQDRKLDPPPVSYRGKKPHGFSSDHRKVTSETLPNGTGLDHLNGQAMQAMTVEIDPDGKLVFKCTERTDQMALPPDPASNHEQ